MPLKPNMTHDDENNISKEFYIIKLLTLDVLHVEMV